MWNQCTLMFVAIKANETNQHTLYSTSFSCKHTGAQTHLIVNRSGMKTLYMNTGARYHLFHDNRSFCFRKSLLG